MNYQDLSKKRDEQTAQRESLESSMVKLLEPICLDVVKVFHDENLEFQVWGMRSESVSAKIPNILRIKEYPYFSSEEIPSIPLKYVKVALQNLSEEGKILHFKRFNSYSMKEVSARYLDSVSGE